MTEPTASRTTGAPSRRLLLGGALAALGGAALAPTASAAVGSGEATTASTTAARDSAARAAVQAAHRGLARYYAAPWPQLHHNTFPSSPGSDDQFNYWWLAHAVDVHVDAFERTGRRTHLTAAERVVEAIRSRNGGALPNDYFDDMNWLALASLRLHSHTRKASALADATTLWEEIVTHGWNDTYGPSVAWRREQLDYKNTPSNAPFAILSYRLHRLTGDPEHLAYADAATSWMRDTLVDPDTGFVADGINRLGDGQVDWAWRFTYCQGVWIGALVEAFRTHGDRALLREAARTATFSVRELTAGPVFAPEGQGDGGLFKGIWYRYVGQLLAELGNGAARREIAGFVRASTDLLADVATDGDVLLAGPDWRTPAPSPTDLATHLSGVMALEARVALSR